MFFVYLALWVFLPDVAQSWGPGMHLELALSILDHLAWVLPSIRLLIEAHPDEFIYGSVSPDIIVGKKYAGYMYHCHNWDIGMLLLNETKNDLERAAAYGYLTHLAADVVAHNYYVPFKIIRSYSTRSLSHAYWEMRYDLSVPDRAWGVIEKMIRHQYSDFDYLMERVLKKTLFSFRTNKKIFNSILILHKMKALRTTLRTYARLSKWTLEEEDVRHYKNLTIHVIRDFLHQFDQAPCIQGDPTGMRKLAYASDLRREMRALVRKEVLKLPQVTHLLKIVRQRLKDGIFRPDLALPTIDAVL